MRPPAGVPRLRTYARILLGGWLVILCATVLSAGVSWAMYTFTVPTSYAASAQLFAVVPGASSVRAAFEGDRASANRMSSYAQLATSRQVLTRTIEDVDLQTTPEGLAGAVSATFAPQSVLLDLRVQDADPQRAMEIANAWSQNVIVLSRELAWNDAGGAPATDLVAVDTAADATAVRPSVWRYVGEGTGIGFALSCVLVLALGLARNIIGDRRQVEDVVREVNSTTGDIR